jgi:ABC-type bacteriocin/lantibiotic exporter with double-glycine peptidase domain
MIARKLRYGRLFRSIIKAIPAFISTEQGQLYIVKTLARLTMWLCVLAVFIWFKLVLLWVAIIVLLSLAIQNIDFHLSKEKYTVQLHTRRQRRMFFRNLKKNGYEVAKKS